jgi:4-alpha-glucanotransferase
LKLKRSAGILLHPTSLPGKFGIGDLGYEAYRFVDFLADAGQKLWQVFPLGPTGYGDSPYQCFSAFAGNPLLISPDVLLSDGLLSKDELYDLPLTNPSKVDFGTIINFKKNVLRKAYLKFRNDSTKDFNKFCTEHSEWLNDFAIFMACKDTHNGKVWSEWESGLVQRNKNTLEKFREKLRDEILYNKFVQYIFFKQWKALKKYANDKGIKIIGDMPIFIAYDSADLWANKAMFNVNKKGKLSFVAGVPPDYFSETGQLWGNPLYKWDVMQKDDFLWWRRRFASLLELVDIIRIDHFRGFEAFWKIPGNSKTAEKGRWIKAPGKELFTVVKKSLGNIPFLAEDLGVITPEVEALRNKFNFPGMKVLQFAFGEDMEEKFLPHNCIPNCVIYTGTHDNDTTRAFFEKEGKNNSDAYRHARKYLNCPKANLLPELIRAAYSSVAVFAIIPMQDILNLDGSARMNFPSTLGGNWSWRFTWDQVSENLTAKYKELSVLYGRSK